MRVVAGRIAHFRNLDEVRLQPSGHFNAFLGPNGQGKTNLLEALFFVSALRPLRAVPRRALLQHGAEESRIQLDVHRQRTGLTHRLELRFRKGSRRLLKDEGTVNTADFLGHFVTVAFTPDDLDLSKGPPEQRRRFLDRAVLNAAPSYLEHALRYQKAMKERNRLLADQGSESALRAYDEVLAREGLELAQRRWRFVEDWAPEMAGAFARIAAPAPPVQVCLQTEVEFEAGVDGYLEKLQESRARDRARRKTSFGPHRDDLALVLGDAPARERASQGQHRAMALAMKLAELKHTSHRLGEAPVLLLDDMSSELDEARQQNLFAAIREVDGQVMLTSTSDPASVARTLGTASELRVHAVRDGAISIEEDQGSLSP
ncbi:MAG: DNA replication/repair protein RecF [Myxococcota bacterium]